MSRGVGRIGWEKLVDSKRGGNVVARLAFAGAGAGGERDFAGQQIRDMSHNLWLLHCKSQSENCNPLPEKGKRKGRVSMSQLTSRASFDNNRRDGRSVFQHQQGGRSNRSQLSSDHSKGLNSRRSKYGDMNNRGGGGGGKEGKLEHGIVGVFVIVLVDSEQSRCSS